MKFFCSTLSRSTCSFCSSSCRKASRCVSVCHVETRSLRSRSCSAGLCGQQRAGQQSNNTATCAKRRELILSDILVHIRVQWEICAMHGVGVMEIGMACLWWALSLPFSFCRTFEFNDGRLQQLDELGVRRQIGLRRRRHHLCCVLTRTRGWVQLH